MEKNYRRSRAGAKKMGYRKAVAHLSIVMMEHYALKELSEAEMRRVEKHVARCPRCRDHRKRPRITGARQYPIREIGPGIH